MSKHYNRGKSSRLTAKCCFCKILHTDITVRKFIKHFEYYHRDIITQHFDDLRLGIKNVNSSITSTNTAVGDDTTATTASATTTSAAATSPSLLRRSTQRQESSATEHIQTITSSFSTSTTSNSSCGRGRSYGDLVSDISLLFLFL